MNRIHTRPIAFCGTAAVGFGLLLVVLLGNGQPQSPPASEVEGLSPLLSESAAEGVGAMRVLRLDTETWQVVGFDGRVVEGEVNHPEEVRARYLANLASLESDSYEKSFPKTSQQKAAIRRALEETQIPAPSEEHLARIPDQGQAAQVRASIDAILNPRTISAKELETVRRNSAGPWSDAVEPTP